MPINFITPKEAIDIESSKPFYKHRVGDMLAREWACASMGSHLDSVWVLAATNRNRKIAQVSLGKSVRTTLLTGEYPKIYSIPAGDPDPDCIDADQGGILAHDRIVLHFDTTGPTVTYRNDEKGNPVITETDEPFDVPLYNSYNIATTANEAEKLVPAKRNFPSGLVFGTEVVDQYFALLEQATQATT